MAKVAFTIDDIKMPVVDQEALVADDNGISLQEKEDFQQQRDEAILRDYVQNIKLRKHFSWALFGLLVFWLIVVEYIVFFSGFKLFGFELSDAVLIALITSTTINVIGLFAIVVRNLFPRVT